MFSRVAALQEHVIHKRAAVGMWVFHRKAESVHSAFHRGRDLWSHLCQTQVRVPRTLTFNSSLWT